MGSEQNSISVVNNGAQMPSERLHRPQDEKQEQTLGHEEEEEEEEKHDTRVGWPHEASQPPQLQGPSE